MRKALLLGLLSLVALRSFAAPVPAALYDGNGTETTFDGILGWFFTPNVNLTVNALGIADLETAGLTGAHEIGIFQANSTAPVVTGSIQAGFAGTSAGSFRFVSVPSTVLAAGTEYYIVANDFTADPYAFGAGHVTFNPALTWNGEGGGLGQDITGTFTNFGRQPGNVGPNFTFETTTPVPEPTSWLFVFGVLGGVLYRSRHHKSL